MKRLKSVVPWVLLGLAFLFSACAQAPGTEKLSPLPPKELFQGLLPQEYLCPGAGDTNPDPRLAKEIQKFLEQNGMIRELPAGVASDLSLILNAAVQKYIHCFVKSNNFHASLARSGRYLPMIRRIFKEHGLPLDLVYVALVESGFSPLARSPKEAVGIWQFIEGTARRYGLKVNDRVDERQDPEKSTRAAARYLHDLYQQFGCWYLAAAGYNAGEKRVEGVVDRHDVRDFWTMAQEKLLPQETCNYVPQVIAAALIAKDPERYGLGEINYQGSPAWGAVKVPGGVRLAWFAEMLELEEKELAALNPELKRGVTPADQKEYLLKVPAQKIRQAKRLANLSLHVHEKAAPEP